MASAVPAVAILVRNLMVDLLCVESSRPGTALTLYRFGRPASEKTLLGSADDAARTAPDDTPASTTSR
jgi:hypothetical protein